MKLFSPLSLLTVGLTAAEQTRVLLVTAHRSGSTFLGELFNRNPNAFYIFEPLASVQNEHSTLGCDEHFDEKSNILERYYNCDAPIYSGADRDVQLKAGVKAKCRTHNVCFRSDMRWACSEDICNSRIGIVPSQDRKDDNCFKCSKMSGSTINGICKSKSIIAQKVIRLCDIDQIAHFKTKIPNLKVIFLYRDPRGIFSSRQKLIGESLAFKTVEKTCDMYSKSLAKSEGGDFLSIRYEDISLDPMAAAEKIYDFVNEELPSSVRNWISDTINAEDVKTVGKSKYSTNKDPIATMTRWRFAQKFEHTQFLQSVCSDYIKKGGYLEVQSATDLENGTIPVFQHFKNDQNGHQL